MRDQSLLEELSISNDHVDNLREQIEKEADPAAIGKEVAAIYLDGIARICAYQNELDVLTGCNIFDPDLTFTQNIARARAILGISAKLTKMLIKLSDRFLRCFGGPNAIALQMIDTMVREDPTRRQWLTYFAEAIRLRRKR